MEARAGDRDASRLPRLHRSRASRLQADRRMRRPPGRRSATDRVSARLDTCVLPVRRVAPGATATMRAELGSDPGAFVFGTFVSLLKLAPRCLSLWRQILERVPRGGPGVLAAQAPMRSRLLPAPAVRIRHSRRRASRSFPHRATKRRDAPVTGGSMPCSIRCRTPVATRPRRRWTWACRWSRASASVTPNGCRYSLLAHLGVTDTVAHTDEDYVAIACRLARRCDMARGASPLPSANASRRRRWQTPCATPAVSKRLTAARSWRSRQLSRMHLHILGICGTFMGGIAAIARQAGHTVTGCDANVYPPMSTQLAGARHRADRRLRRRPARRRRATTPTCSSSATSSRAAIRCSRRSSTRAGLTLPGRSGWRERAAEQVGARGGRDARQDHHDGDARVDPRVRRPRSRAF